MLLNREQLLESLNNTKNPALKEGMKTALFIQGQGGIKQFIKDFLERFMQLKGLKHLGFDPKNVHNIPPEEVTKKVEQIFPGKSEAIFEAVSQFPAGMIAYALDQGLACTNDGTGKSIAISQPKPEHTHINLTADPNNPDDLILECTYDEFPVTFFEQSNLDYSLQGPVKVVFRLKKHEQHGWGFEFETLETENKLVQQIFQGEILSDEALIPDKDVDDLFNSAVFIPKTDTLRNGNNDPKKQFNRDIDFISQAIENPGNPFSARILRKLYTLLYFGNVHYKKDNAWHLWRDNPADIPVASILCHGSRTLMQFPAELRGSIMAWLFEGKEAVYARYSATHGIETTNKELVGDTEKVLCESKKGIVEATLDTVKGMIPQIVSTKLQHFGVDLALGGAGKRHPHSDEMIACNGKNGHLYICSNEPVQTGHKATAGLLFGIEQSAPGQPNQYGGAHGITGAHLNYTATGGDDFAKRPWHVKDDYQGLKGLGPDTYYDSLFLSMDQERFEHIKMLEENFQLSWLKATGQALLISPKIDIQKLKVQELEPLRAEVDSLLQKKEELLKIQAELLRNSEKLQEKLTTGQQVLSSTEEKLSQSLIKLNQLQQNQINIEKEVEDLNLLKDNLEKHCQKLQKTNDSLKKEEELLKNRIQAAQKQTVDLEKKTEQQKILEECLRVGEEQTRKLDQALHDKQIAHDDLTNDLKKLTTQHDTVSQAVKLVKEQQAQLLKENENQLKIFEERLRIAQERAEALERENNQKQEKLKLSDKSQEQLELLEKEIQQKQERVEELNRRQLALTRDVKRLTEENEQLIGENKIQKSASEQLQNEIPQLNQEKLNLTEAVRLLTEQQAQLKRENEEQLKQNKKIAEIPEVQPPFPPIDPIQEVPPSRPPANPRQYMADLPLPNARLAEQSFLRAHWKKMLVGALIGAALVVAGVFTAGIVPLIAASLGVSILAASAIGFGGGALLGGLCGVGAGAIAGALPTKVAEPGVKGFFARHKGKIIVGGIIAGLLVAGLLTGGVLAGLGIITGVGLLAAIATGISTGVASTVGVTATVTTAVTGAAIVTAGAATVGTTTGMLVGALIDNKTPAVRKPEPDQRIENNDHRDRGAAKTSKCGCFSFFENLFKRKDKDHKVDAQFRQQM